MDGEAGALRCAGDFLAKPDVAEFAGIGGGHGLVFRGLLDRGLLDGFALFAADLLVGIADSLALVRLGRIVGADIGGDLSDEMLINSLNRDLGVVSDGYLDFLRDREENRVGVADGKVELVSLYGSTEAYSLNFKVAPEALAHPSDHVVDQGAGETMKGPNRALFGSALHREDSSVDGGGDALGKLPLKLALGSFNSHTATLIQSDLDV